MLVGVSDCLPRSRAYKNTSPWTINPTSNAGGATPASPTAILPSAAPIPGSTGCAMYANERRQCERGVAEQEFSRRQGA